MTTRVNLLRSWPGFRCAAPSLRGACVCVLLLAIAGCGGSSGPPRLPVQGLVKVDGQSVEKGQIRFAPAAGTKAPLAATEITDGQYRFNRQDGPLAGEYIVTISVGGPTGVVKEGPPASKQTGPKGGGVSTAKTYSQSLTVTPKSLQVDLNLSAATGR